MEVGERRLAQQRQAGGELLLALARKAGDDVGAERRAAAARATISAATSRTRAAVVEAAHAAQDAVGAGLHRHVQVRAQHRRCAPSGRAAAASPRAGRSSSGECAAAAPRSAIISTRSASVERRRQVLPVAAEVDAGQHHLAEAARRQPLELGEDAARLDAAAAAARERHDAEGAEEIAALLHLEEGARLAG